MKSMRTGRTRPAWARIQEIHRRLESGSYPNCAGLAADLEVSAATLKRDLEFMRDRLQLPLAYDPRRHGYCYLAPAPSLVAKPAMSEGECFALAVADQAVAQYPGLPFREPLRLALEKLAARAGDGAALLPFAQGAELSFRPLGAEAVNRDVLQTLTCALRERRVLRFQYRNLGMTGMRSRRVRPYHLACIENHWYLFAYDLQRRAIRTFALSRLVAPELTRERFTRPQEFAPDRYLAGSFGVLRGQADYEVVVELDPWATDLVRGRQWHPSQELTELPGGGSRLRLRLTGLEEVERWVLSWGTHATIVRPLALVDRVRRVLQLLEQRYRADSPDRPVTPAPP